LDELRVGVTARSIAERASLSRPCADSLLRNADIPVCGLCRLSSLHQGTRTTNFFVFFSLQKGFDNLWLVAVGPPFRK
jgi:hypothetical protein